MKTLTTILLAIILAAAMTCPAWAQTKKIKQHIFYDTVKQVVQRVDYSPDTIPVYFKEIRIVVYNNHTLKLGWQRDSVITVQDSTIQEQWHKGYVIHQTYIKQGTVALGRYLSTGTFSTFHEDYYTDNYEASPILTDTFLYEDRKTRVKNRVIFSIKR